MTDISGTARGLPDPTLAYSRVDDQPRTQLLVACMQTVARWPAVQRLRAWETSRLALRAGERVLDVGCGTGDVAVGMAAQVGSSGTVIGVDASETMLGMARARAAAVGAAVDFRRADVADLGLADGSVDACRAERVLQWVSDQAGAMHELARVLQPGGRLVLIDTDWRTLTVDLPDRDAAATLERAVVRTRGEGAGTGGRLVNLCRDAGLREVAAHAEVHLWTSWDPNVDLGPSEFFPPRVLVPELVEAGSLTPDEGDRVLAAMVDAARRDRLFLSLTMLAVYGVRPSA